MLLIRTSILILAMTLTTSSYAEMSWVKMANIPGEAKHRCSGFSIGSKGYIGGGHINSTIPTSYEDWWEYDPATDSWTQIADYGGGRRYQMGTFSINGHGYAGCGEDETGNYRSDFWRYVPLVNTWFPLTDLPGLARRGPTSFVINDVPYVGLGQSGGPLNGGYELDFYSYNDASDEWIPISDFIGNARTGGVGFAYGDKGYVGTGHMSGAATRDFFEYDSGTNIWTQLADVDTTYRQDATGFELNGKGYILTGNDLAGDISYDDIWEYDFATDIWKQLPDFHGASRRFMVSFVIGNFAYAGGGTNGTNLTDFWRYDPTYSSISEFDLAGGIKIYPNPSTDFVTVDLTDTSTKNEYRDIRLFNAQGKLVLRKKLYNEENTISLSGFVAGTYTLKVHSSVGEIASTQIIKL
ncbi:T9SS type A sorting domain-containing protein [Crocinitomix catalasitica]|nr:T9SS type A sorting domain-containing protein [Crocinitomix catalasitica]